ncbi:MAG: DinB family protein [Frankia sp.]|nr:DinB family protein [Frankia sp.]
MTVTSATTPTSTAAGTAAPSEYDELLNTLAKHRAFLRFTVRDLTDEQARQRTTVSALTLGGLIKHVAEMESLWLDFVLHGPSVFGSEWDADGFRLVEGETLAGALAEYEKVARRTEEIVRGLPDLGASRPLPQAPWFEPGTRWSVRQVLLHLIAETAQHSGHADIIRESLDGQKTMG